MGRKSKNNNYNNSYHGGGGGRNPPLLRSSSNSLQQMNVSDEIDGSKFKGGTRRTTSRVSSSSLQHQDQQEVKTEAKSRPKLNIKPRTKPLENKEPSPSQSSIFGTGKKRDEQTYNKTKEHKSSDAATEPVKIQQKVPPSSAPNNTDKGAKASNSNKPSNRAKKGSTNNKSFTGTKKYETSNNTASMSGLFL